MNNLDIKIASALEKLEQVQRVLLWNEAKKESLSPIQIQFLIYLERSPDLLRSVSRISKEFELTKATVSDALSTLEDKGIVKKTRLADDKRAYCIDLTAKGKKIVTRIKNWQDDLTATISAFPLPEKETVLIFLTELIKSIYDKGIISSARLCITCANFVRGVNGEKDYCSLTDTHMGKADITIGCDHHESSRAC